MTALERLARDYRVALLHYLSHRPEAALHRGYEIGRSAVVDGLSLLELVDVHHDVLAGVLHDSPDAVSAVTYAAGEFLREVLATYDMAQRRLQAPG